MKKSMLGKLKENKAKVAEDKARTANVERLRQVIKTWFYPLLKKETKNIEAASMFCQVIVGQIQAGYNAMDKVWKLKDLDLIKFFPKDDTDTVKYVEVLKKLENETIADALMILDGFPRAIGACVNKELKTRKLEDLKELEDDFR